MNPEPCSSLPIPGELLVALERDNSKGLRPHVAGWLEDFELDNLSILILV
jgi:hypothetical protein